ncbi:MAG: hypothetical protein HETSPECPRED_001716 [Heterodermia speciosa]|uniref:Uncharacterized protein n=1 Tax=Heterodermia speciosa TaxID=116794 RepID=A0A8H3EWQ8_9LECA|nr:MAG: hypothetical protein HETSPECPRED_001716 [Heterodermia speciosa]
MPGQKQVMSTTYLHRQDLSSAISWAAYVRCRGLRPTQRCYSWRTKRGSPLDSSNSLPAISYTPSTATHSSKTMYRSYFWRRGHFLNQYTQSPEWRFLSSWRKANDASRCTGGWHNDAGKDRGTGDYDWYGEWQKRHAESLKQFEDFKRMMDEDPYGALFGRRTRAPNEEKTSNQTTTPGNDDAHGSNQRSATATVNACERKPVRDPTRTLKTSPDQTHSSDEICSRSNNSDEFTIDPITMRKIFKTQVPPPPQEVGAKDEFGSFDIPVKTYKVPGQSSPTTRSNENVHPTIRKLKSEGQDWLAQEGFGAAPQAVKSAKARASREISKIESALERHLRKEKGAEGDKGKDTAALTYHTAENRTEDIDLLTASDIRASAGRVSKPSKNTPKEKQERRETLENDYRRRSEKLEKRLDAEVAASKEQSKQKLIQELQDIARDLRRCDAARSAHEQEIKEQKSAMETHEACPTGAKRSGAATAGHNVQPGEGDMALNVHEFASRDRWYKQKAPHASAEAEYKLRQASKDRAFVREIRGIYEDQYGTIDTKHRQEPKKQPAEVSDYPGDAYPGTLYEQPWSANVLNDHPEIDSQGNFPNKRSVLQGHHEQQEFQALSLIGRLFGELRENQALLQDNRAELRKIPTKDESMNLFQSLKAHEQRVMHTLKAAQTLIKGATAEINRAQVGVPSDISLTRKQEPASTATSSEQDLSPEASQHVSTTVYKILAYDPSTQKVLTTKTSTLTASLTEKSLSLSEALSGLENPARFLPHFAGLQNAQYELAAGGPNFLVFKKARQAQPPSELEAPHAEPIEPSRSIPHRYANPIDGTTTQIGNFASPTGFVNYDPPFPMEEALKDPPPIPNVDGRKSKPKDKVRRQEDVFSGSSRRAWHDHHEHNRIKAKSKHRRSIRRRKTFKRMFLVGLLTAGGCYAVGVASEFLRM